MFSSLGNPKCMHVTWQTSENVDTEIWIRETLTCRLEIQHVRTHDPLFACKVQCCRKKSREVVSLVNLPKRVKRIKFNLPNHSEHLAHFSVCRECPSCYDCYLVRHELLSAQLVTKYYYNKQATSLHLGTGLLRLIRPVFDGVFLPAQSTSLLSDHICIFYVRTSRNYIKKRQ